MPMRQTLLNELAKQKQPIGEQHPLFESMLVEYINQLKDLF